jgi:hypothetical protein
MSRHPRSETDVCQLRDAQTDSLQALLFTMEELGEPAAFLQMEFEGVLHFVAARKLTQSEFEKLMRQAVCKS